MVARDSLMHMGSGPKLPQTQIEGQVRRGLELVLGITLVEGAPVAGHSLALQVAGGGRLSVCCPSCSGAPSES